MVDESSEQAPAVSEDAPGAEEASASGQASGTASPRKRLTRAERRARTQAAKARPRPPRTPEERQAERDAERKLKALLRRNERIRTRARGAEASVRAAATPPRERAPGVQKTRQGVVVSDRADKTITVRIDTARRHRRYEKIVRTSQTLHAHDESNDAHVGDTVVVRESRPLSRTKRWRLVDVIERAK